ncbi:hypothetical protein [Stackebrandtia soli]|uniref:hypothetical protein n=1 Tax=Stackebrandtia soli TaxID=1892856 RepID=UPI0039EA9F58
MVDDPGFRLTDGDRAALAELYAFERGSRWIAVVMVAVVLAVAGYIAMTVTPRWAAALSAPSLVFVAAWILRFKVFRGSGSAGKVLAGGQPVMVLSGTMVDADGEHPYPLTLEFDVPNDDVGFVYFGMDEPSWLSSPGARFTLHLFWNLFPADGVACVESLDSGHRHWTGTLRSGSSRAYSQD